MKKIYRDEYEANLDNQGEPSKFFIEVPRDCYQRKDEFTKTDILVYSAILAGLNNQMSDLFSYPNAVIAERLRIDERQVRRSIGNLRSNDWITVFKRKGNGRSIRVKCDLRLGCQTGKKNVIRVYDRIFSYPLITKPMVHVYSYYLSLSGMDRYKNGCDVSCETASKSLGYSEKRFIQILDEMAEIGLVKIQREGRRKRVKLLVDFSKEQPEEIQYKKEEKRRKEQIEMEYEKNRNNEANNSEMVEEDYTDEQIAEMMRADGFVVTLKDGRIVSAYRPDVEDDDWKLDGDFAPEEYYERLAREEEQRKKWENSYDDDDMPF